MTPELLDAAKAISTAYNAAVDSVNSYGSRIGAWLSDTEPETWLKGVRDAWNEWIGKANAATSAAETNTLIIQAENIINGINYTLQNGIGKVTLRRAALETISDDPNVETFDEALRAAGEKYVKPYVPEPTTLFITGVMVLIFLTLLLVFALR